LCSFAGSIGPDPTGTSYAAHLQSVEVEPHFVTAAAHPSAVSVCLVTPDGQRTMRTCLGAASSFAREHLPPADVMQTMQLLHCEGYTAYKSGLLEAVAEASKAAGATFSLDMASFEVVRNCWSSLQAIIESGHVEVLFCNEDEASEIIRQYGVPLIADVCICKLW
jgi:sugar/nucleoside kinase (ribokinase family)